MQGQTLKKKTYGNRTPTATDPNTWQQKITGPKPLKEIIMGAEAEQRREELGLSRRKNFIIPKVIEST